MDHPLIHDRGPELVGTRTTIYNLIPYFIDPSAIEADITASNGITVEQLAAMRAYAFHHYSEVMEEHLRIEARIQKSTEAQNLPEFREKVAASHKALKKFQAWFSEKKLVEVADSNGSNLKGFPTFREWLATQPEQQHGGH